MKTPALLGPDGRTSLREYAGYHGGGHGFGGQLRGWQPQSESPDAALLPNFARGNARADDLVRNNGYAANAIQLHQDHIVGSFFRLSHRPSWRFLGISEEDARAFSREVEAAWKEFAEDDNCFIDAERKRTFTMMIREGVAMHSFNGELCVQPAWDSSPGRLFRTQFKMVSPKRISNPNNTGDTRNCRAGVAVNNTGAAVGYYVSDDGYPGWMPQKWTYIPRELAGGRTSFIHIFEPLEDGQTRGANQFYSVMEQMKMLDTLQNTQLQSAIVKAMYAATIESELDTQTAMDFILGADNKEQQNKFTGWLAEMASYYSAAPVRLGGAKVPHLMPGDSLNLQSPPNADNGYSVFEQSLLRYISAGLGVSFEQLSRNYSQMSYSTARASANESWAFFMGRRKFVASRQACMMFLCWLEEAIIRRVVTLPSRARFSFQEARSAWGNCDWIGSGRMAIDGLKEVQESEANRKGRWGILTNNKDRVVTFSVGLDGNIPQPGYVIAVADEMLSGKVTGGRISSVNGRVITLDRVADITPGNRLIMNLPSGVSQARTVQAVNGRAITVTTAYGETPQAECVWVAESDELYAQQYRVVSVADNNDGTFTISGAFHDPDKYARIDTGAIIDQRPVSVVPPGNQHAPENIIISSFSVVQQGISVETMRASWDQAPNAIAYEAQWRRNDGNWVNVPRSSTTSFDIPGIYAGRYLVRVRAINAAEISSGWGYSEEKTLTGKVGNPPKPVGFMATGINWGIRLNWGFPANTADTLKTEIQYTANSDFSDPLLLSDVPYPSSEYTQLGLRAGQEFWYRAQLVDKTGNESGYTDWIRGMSNDNADDYLGDIAGGFLTSEDGDRLTGDIDTSLEAALQNALANHATVEHQWAQLGEVRADILIVKTTIADVDKAMAELSTQVQAQIEDVTATLEDKLTAVVDADGATAIHTLKAGVRINGVMYNAGMSIAVLAQAGQPVITRVGFNANQFVLMSGSGTTQYSPFAVVNGQVFISSAFIQDGTITNAKIANYIRSNNFLAGTRGWNIDKSGDCEFHGKFYADSGQFAFNGVNNTVVINGNGITVNLSGGGRVVVGKW